MYVLVDDLWKQIAPCSTAPDRRHSAPTGNCWPWPGSANVAAGTWRPNCSATSAITAISSPNSPPGVASTAAASGCRRSHCYSSSQTEV